MFPLVGEGGVRVTVEESGRGKERFIKWVGRRKEGTGILLGAQKDFREKLGQETIVAVTDDDPDLSGDNSSVSEGTEVLRGKEPTGHTDDQGWKGNG